MKQIKHINIDHLFAEEQIEFIKAKHTLVCQRSGYEDIIHKDRLKDIMNRRVNGKSCFGVDDEKIDSLSIDDMKIVLSLLDIMESNCLIEIYDPY